MIPEGYFCWVALTEVASVVNGLCGQWQNGRMAWSRAEAGGPHGEASVRHLPGLASLRIFETD